MPKIAVDTHVCDALCDWSTQFGDWLKRLKCLSGVPVVHVDTRIQNCSSLIWYGLTGIEKSLKLEPNQPPRRITFDVELFSSDFDVIKRVTSGLSLVSQLQNNQLPFGRTCRVKSVCISSQDESYRQKSPGIDKGEFAIFMLVEIQPYTVN